MSRPVEAAEPPVPVLAALFEHLPDAVYLLEPQTSRIVWCNRAGWASLGLTPTEVLNHSVLSLQMDVSGAPAWADIADVIRGTDCYTFVGRHRHADGHELAVEVNTSHFSHDGHEYFLSVARDVSRRVALEATMKQRDVQLAFALNEAMDGLWDWDIPSGTVFFSPQLKRMLGYGPDEMEPRLETWSRNVHPDDAPVVMAALNAHLEGRRTRYEARYRLRNRNGDFRWVSDRGLVCERDAEGRPTRAVGMVQDVTGEQLAQQALQRSESAQRTLIASLPDVIMRFDREGRHLYVSENVTTLAPLSAADIIGKTHRELGFPESLCARWDDEIASVFSTGRPIESEFALPGPDGDRLVSWRLVPDRSEGEGVRTVLAVCRDVTARRQAEAELERHRHHLEELVAARTAELAESTAAAQSASRAKTRFLATMSHELRTPLTAIIGMTELAMRRSTGDAVRQPLRKVEAAAQHLLQVINDVLDISRIEAERLTLEDTEFTLAGVLDGVDQLARHRAEERGLALLIELPPGIAGLPLRGDPLRLKQVLLNLVDNAIKFTPKGRVALRVSSTDPAGDPLDLQVEVIDDGIGVDALQLPRLFEPFEQADGAISRRYGGSGLGLAICRRLVQMMGGLIGVDSEPGHGSRFWFRLALHRAAAALATPAPESREFSAECLPALRHRHGGRAVLVVEDEPISREVAMELLRMADLNVDLAEDGEQALALCRERAYGLILLDMQMPRLSGLQVAPLIHELPLNGSTPIVALTANALDEDRQRCLDAGMVAHLAKPVEASRLFAEVLRWLDRNGAGAAGPTVR